MFSRKKTKKPFRKKKMFNTRKKACRICVDKIKIDYKDDKLLVAYIMESGKIVPCRSSGACSKHQRAITEAIKRARIMALLPFSSQQLTD